MYKFIFNNIDNIVNDDDDDGENLNATSLKLLRKFNNGNIFSTRIYFYISRLKNKCYYINVIYDYLKKFVICKRIVQKIILTTTKNFKSNGKAYATTIVNLMKILHFRKL